MLMPVFPDVGSTAPRVAVSRRARDHFEQIRRGAILHRAERFIHSSLA
jgi:hypothetical protein